MVADRYFNMAKSRLHRSVTNAVDCAVRIHIGVKPRQPAGAMLARGRRTASSWFRAGGVNDDWDRVYELLVPAGKVAT